MEDQTVFMMPFFIPLFVLWQDTIYYETFAQCVPILGY